MPGMPTSGKRARPARARPSSCRSENGRCGSPAPTASTSRPGARPSSTWPATTSASATESCARCASDPACCTASREASTPRRSTRSASPSGAPDWLNTVRVTFPRYGRHADELCVTELAHVIWAVQMSTVEFHPWNSRCADVERPDEWRIDIDPMPDCPFSRVQRVADVAHEVLDELGRGRLAEDLRRQRDPRLRPDRAALGLSRRPPGRPGLRPRGGAPRSRRRHHHLVAQGPRARQGVRRLQPERPRSHHRLRLLGPRDQRWNRVDADHLGRDR